jgi:crossover junction endodeoxyribonuclease RuvC
MKPLKTKAARVLAVDPGFDRCGVAVLEGDASRPSYVWSACIQPAKGAPEERLAELSCALAAALKEHAPHALAIESLFFSTNKKTAMGVAQARGVILAAAGNAGIPVLECSPAQVKLAVTGAGNAEKAAVARMIPRLITLPAKKRLDDELDAIALGIAALARRNEFAQMKARASA